MTSPIDRVLKEFDEKFTKKTPPTIKIKQFIAERIRGAIKEYDSLLCLNDNCREMDRIEKYYAGFGKVLSISEARKSALKKFGVEE